MGMTNWITLATGARLGYACYGREDGVPAFYFHGLPGSRLEGRLLHEACVAAGVRLIAPDRPGYGLSEPIPGPRLVAWPHDISQLADRLGFENFYLFAASGGGPYALACASALHERVRGTGICCGLGQINRPELRAAMRLNARLGFWLAEHNPNWLRYSYGAVITLGARFMPTLSIEVLAQLEGQPDRQVLRQPEIRTLFAASLREAFRQGSPGGVADMCAALDPWPFELAQINNLQLWHGLADRVVPVSHSEQVVQQVPEARLYRVEGEGHFSLPIRYAEQVVRAVLATG